MGTGKNSKVSVVILTFGNFEGLTLTLGSVLEQNVPIAEILVSDDGSGKAFPQAIVEEYGKKVRFQQNAVNVGTVAHMNAAAKETKGEYIKFIGAGDALASPAALGRLLRCAEASGAAIATSQSVVRGGLRRSHYAFPRKAQLRNLCRDNADQYAVLATENCISAVGTIFHRDFFDKYDGFSEDYRLLEDWPAWLRETRAGRKIAVLPEITSLYALGGVSSKDIDAFASPVLRKEMLRCYEAEILPFMERIPQEKVQRIMYRYALLCDVKERELFRKFPILHMKTMLKRRIKKWMFR